MNTTWSKPINTTPYRMVYGQDPHTNYHPTSNGLAGYAFEDQADVEGYESDDSDESEDLYDDTNDAEEDLHNISGNEIDSAGSESSRGSITRCTRTMSSQDIIPYSSLATPHKMAVSIANPVMNILRGMDAMILRLNILKVCLFTLTSHGS